MTTTYPPTKILPVAMKGAPVLRQRATPYAVIDSDARDLAHNMLATLKMANGIGLAANQVGVAKRLIVVDIRGHKDVDTALYSGLNDLDVDQHMPMMLFNPEITLSGSRVVKVEGCLSQPGVSGRVERSMMVNVVYQDLFGNVMCLGASGMLARVIQHEVDHLDGILFTDRLVK